MSRFERRDYSIRLARNLRKSMSEAEIRLWWHLRRRLSAKFRRQEPIGSYITDFCCYKARLVVEVDGSQHGDTREYDMARDDFLKAQGFRVLRVSAADVMKNIDGILEAVATRVHSDT